MVEHRFFDYDSVHVRNVAAGWNARPHQLCTEGISGIRKSDPLDLSLARAKITMANDLQPCVLTA